MNFSSPLSHEKFEALVVFELVLIMLQIPNNNNREVICKLLIQYLISVLANLTDNLMC